MMSKRMSGWAVVLAVTVFIGRAAAGEGPGQGRAGTPSPDAAEATKTIDTFCDGLAPITKTKERRRLFGLFQNDQNDRGRWVEFKSDAALDAAAKAEHVYDVARVWSREDGAVAVSMSLSSGSGDWAHYVEYCFRTDGTLARTNSTLNTFNAVDEDESKDVSGARRERDRYFDGSGKQVKVSRRLLDLENKRPAPTLQIMDAEEPIYKTAAALPFHRLLKGRRAAQDRASPRR